MPAAQSQNPALVGNPETSSLSYYASNHAAMQMYAGFILRRKRQKEVLGYRGISVYRSESVICLCRRKALETRALFLAQAGCR